MKEYFLSNGRIGRLQYLTRSIISFLLVALFGFGIQKLSIENSIGLQVSSWVVWFVFCWFAIVQCIKRLHDLDKGWWYLLIALIPIVNFFFWLYLIFSKWTGWTNKYWIDPLVPVEIIPIA